VQREAQLLPRQVANSPPGLLGKLATCPHTGLAPALGLRAGVTALPLYGRPAHEGRSTMWFHLALAFWRSPSARKRRPQPSPNWRPGLRPRVARPWLEILEDRLAPAIITVTSPGDTSVVDGAVTLREALLSIDQGSNVNADVNAVGSYGTNDTINFAPSVTGTITLTGDLPGLTKNIQIDGPGASVLTVSGNNAFDVFSVPGGGTAGISGLTVANAFGGVGAIANAGTLTLDGCTVKDSVTTLTQNSGAGGVFNSYGTLTINNCTISGDSVNGSEAIGNVFGTLTINNCTVAANFGEQFVILIKNAGGNASVANSSFTGGSIFVDGPSTLSDCTLQGCSIETGSALEGVFPKLLVDHCSITGNSSENGGAIVITPNMGAFVTIQDSTISGNSTSVDGGAIWDGGAGQVTLRRCTIMHNSAGRDGGAIYDLNDGIENGLTIIDCQIHDNSAGRDGGAVFIEPAQTAAGSTSESVSIQDSSLSKNSAARDGGAICTTVPSVPAEFAPEDFLANLNISNCDISENAAGGDGGGVYTALPDIPANTIVFSMFVDYGLTINASTLADNSAVGNGGGLYNSAGNLPAEITLIQYTFDFTANDDTLAANSAGGNGGGIYGNDAGTLILHSAQ
jgi:predicted outer membrane repeat protein